MKYFCSSNLIHLSYIPSMKRVYWLGILFVLLHAACDRCKRLEGTFEKTEWGAVIDTKEVTPIGSINGKPVVKCVGEIKENHPGKEEPILGVFFVPQGQSIDEVAKKIKNHNVKTKADAPADAKPMKTLIKLGEGSLVNYERVEKSTKKEVIFCISSLKPDEGLASNTTYNVVIFIKIGDHIFYDVKQAVSYTTPNPGDLTQVSMLSAEPTIKIDPKGNTYVEFAMKANVKQLNTTGSPAHVGFLLIKQGTTPLSSLDVLEEQLANGKPFPTYPRAFLASADDAFIINENAATFPWGVLAADDDFEINNELDPNAAMKGGKYDVYAYVQQHDAATKSNNYFVSPDSIEIELPEIKVEVEITGIGEPKLIAIKNPGGGYSFKEFKLPEVKGKVKKAENTNNPIAGVLIVPQTAGLDLTQEAARQQASEIVAKATSNFKKDDGTLGNVPQYKQERPDGQGCLVCITQKDDVADTDKELQVKLDLKQQGADASLLDLAACQNYDVYYWVQDAGGKGLVFISEARKPLQVFYADALIAPSKKQHYHHRNKLYLNFHVNVDSKANVDEAVMGVVFMKKGMGALDVPLMNRIRAIDLEEQEEIGFETFGYLRAGKRYYIWPKSADIDSGERPQIQPHNAITLEAEQDYTVYLWARAGGVVYGYNSTPYTTPIDSPGVENTEGTLPNPCTIADPYAKKGSDAADGSDVKEESAKKESIAFPEFDGKKYMLIPTEKPVGAEKPGGGRIYVKIELEQIRVLKPQEKKDKALIRFLLSRHYSGDELEWAKKNFDVLDP